MDPPEHPEVSGAEEGCPLMVYAFLMTALP
jgi:hypothetical protein